MQKLEAIEYGSRKPEAVTYLPQHVDVAENIRQETRKDPQGNSETVWVADVTRYGTQEYLALVAEKAETASKAVAELSDLVLTKDAA